MKFLARFRRSQTGDDTEQELQSHIQHRADDLERSGLPRAEAERRARIEFGSYVRFKEESHEAAGGIFLETLIQDVRVVVRGSRKSPGFAVAAVVTLALAIGANAVVFAVLNGLILRPLNVPRAHGLYSLERAGDKLGNESYPNYLDLRDRNRSFDGLIAHNISQAGLDTGKDPSRVWLYEVSGNYFDVLGIQPYLGRVIHPSDEQGPNSAPYVVLSYAYWHSHFQNDRGVVGRTVHLNKHPFSIIGVAPPGFRGTLLPFSPDFFVPIVNQEQVDGSNGLNDRGNRWVTQVTGHLKADVTTAQAIADLNSIGSYLKKSYPKDEDQMTFLLARPGLGSDFLDRPIRTFLTGLALLASLILLAACANLGSLFAARAADRTREVALRLALGAGRIRILRQLLTEAVLISLVGGAVGLWGSVMLLHGLSAWRPFPEYPFNAPVNPDASVYLVALLMSFASGFLFGAAPARQVLHADPHGVIKSGSTARLGDRFVQRITTRDLLLGAQIAICAVLVTSSIVAVRGLARSLHSNFGFDPQNAILIETDLNMAGYRGNAVPVMQRRMIEAMEAIPGVTSVGLVGQDPPLHARFHRVSGNPPRSTGVSGRGSGDVAPGLSGYMDSSATRAVARPGDPAARRVTRPQPRFHGGNRTTAISVSVPMGRCVFCLLVAITLTGAVFAHQAGDQPTSTFGTTVVISGGLRGTVYFIPKDTTVLPDFESSQVRRVGEIWIEALNIPPRHWRSGFPGLTGRFEWFAIDYNGRFWIDKPGRYTFALLSDDGSRLFLDDIPVIDNDCQHPPDLRIAAVKLEGGVHQIRVSYFQGPRDCLALVLAIAGPDRKWKVFSTKEFKPPSNPEDWQYPAANSSTIVPTTPDEASVTKDDLFRKLIDADPAEEFAIKSVGGKGCSYYPPIRTCAN